MPVNVATAPMSARPCVSRAISAPTSKSSRCSRTKSASGHRREERNLTRALDRSVRLHVRVVDRRADDLRVLERIGIFLAAFREPGHEFPDGANAHRRIDLLLRLAN